ncbi:hypothetical protein DVH24_040864 [Malus domestica]|uniref:Cytochrome b-c1 complex subunit 8 n=3 Tax=Maleae TaxID=721813 RepID=A0A498ICI5_MALDO|nr:hypothetical protein DVH24_040864 [Malus domestica]
MGKIPVKMRAVVYALSPFQQKVMPGLWKDFTGKIHHKVSENWLSATLLLTPLVATYSYVQYYQEQEKLEHRYQVKVDAMDDCPGRNLSNAVLSAQLLVICR